LTCFYFDYNLTENRKSNGEEERKGYFYGGIWLLGFGGVILRLHYFWARKGSKFYFVVEG